MKTRFLESELIITPGRRVYHINLRGEDIADDVIVVGDPSRVAQISKHFDKIEFKTRHREFITHTGMYGGKRFTVLSTGIGIGNIDIVLTELDAAVNINLEKRELLPTHRTLNIVRLGTCGALQADIPVDSLIASTHGIGMDGLLTFYDNFESVCDKDMTREFIKQTGWQDTMPYPYTVAASPELLNRFKDKTIQGITATAPGFYGPQGRKIRLSPALPDINERLTAFRHKGMRIVNFEMETSALYGMAALLDHNHLTVCTVIANRLAKKFSGNMSKSIDSMISTALNCLHG